jgi:cyclase
VGFAREVAALGAGELLVTSMDRDGTKGGYDLALTRAIADAVSMPGDRLGGRGRPRPPGGRGAGGHASAVLAASIFHFGQHSIGEAKAHMARAGLAMRLDA